MNNNLSEINNTGTTSITSLSMWSMPIRIEVRELQNSIEMIYKETSQMTLTVWPPRPTETRVFKIVFSCVDGKWNKSEPIYGKIISAQEESYEFK